MTTQDAPITTESIRVRVFEGVLSGTAVGDALGLPAENLSPGRIQRLWRLKSKHIGGTPVPLTDWRMQLAFGRGMISDDTEHTLMVAQALLSEPNDAAAFQRVLAWKFRWWFACVPAGMGLATAKACLKLWIGVPASRSAVNSGGSGPAMRSAIIGAYFANDLEKRREFVRASSRLTHKGWQAETAALAVAEATAVAVTTSGELDARDVLLKLRGLSSEAEWQEWMGRIESGLAERMTVGGFVRSCGLERGVSGYSLHVVSAALYAWLLHRGDFRSALCAALDCGGDTDTVGAIVGALCGASGGVEGIPREWIEGIVEWPRSVGFMREVARRLGEQKTAAQPLGEVRYFWPGVILRNPVFLVVVLAHGFRRLLPPY